MNPILVVGGLVLATKLFKKKQCSCPLPSFKGIIETAHFLPSRIRFRIPLLKKDPEACTVLAGQLNRMNVITSVSVSPITSSVLITFEKVEPVILMGAIIRLLNLDEQIEQTRESFVTKKIMCLKKITNDSIYDTTNGILDFNALLTLFLAGSTIYTLGGNIRNITSPGSAVLAWWTYNSLL